MLLSSPKWVTSWMHRGDKENGKEVLVFGRTNMMTFFNKLKKQINLGISQVVLLEDHKSEEWSSFGSHLPENID